MRALIQNAPRRESEIDPVPGVLLRLLFSANFGADGELILYVSRKRGNLHSFEMVCPGAIYGESSKTDTTMARVSSVNYDDSRQMLEDWVLAAPSVEKGDEHERYARWLSVKATPDDWHFAVEAWNLDRGWVPIFWIIRQPTCEIATALETFYRHFPYGSLEVLQGQPAGVGEDLEEIKLACELRTRLLDGFYRCQTIAFDGEGRVEKAFGKNEMDSSEVMQAIPPALRQKFGTRAPIDQAGPWSDGLPAAVIDDRR